MGNYLCPILLVLGDVRLGKGQACDLSKDTYESLLGREGLNLWLFVTALVLT